MRLWLDSSLLLAALLLGTTFAHVLEIRAKRQMDGALWTTLQHRLYGSFATIGGTVEIGAILTTAALAWLLRQSQGRWLAAAALACFALAFAGVWIGVVMPVNREVFRWSPAAVPPRWERWRRRWDLGHAIRFGLHLIGFCLLVAVCAGSRIGGH
jgi:hypothetical protein